MCALQNIYKLMLLKTFPQQSSTFQNISSQKFCFPHQSSAFLFKVLLSSSKFCFPHQSSAFLIKVLLSSSKFCFPHQSFDFIIKVLIYQSSDFVIKVLFTKVLLSLSKFCLPKLCSSKHLIIKVLLYKTPTYSTCINIFKTSAHKRAKKYVMQVYYYGIKPFFNSPFN